MVLLNVLMAYAADQIKLYITFCYTNCYTMCNMCLKLHRLVRVRKTNTIFKVNTNHTIIGN